MGGDQKSPSNWKLRVAAMVIVILITLLCLEVMAWTLFGFREQLKAALYELTGDSSLSLDAYEMKAPGVAGHWRLKPGYGISTDDLIVEKLNDNKWLGANSLRQVQSPNLPQELVVNSDGYKGPELNQEHNCVRVLTIGDSVTFGLGGVSYPYFMNREFAARDVRVEVVNGGVEGYAPRNALLELPRYKELEADIVTIYIGWNALYGAPPPKYFTSRTFKTPWLLERVKYALSLLLYSGSELATNNYSRSLQPDPDAPAVKNWRTTEIKFLNDVEALIQGLRSSGSQVYIVTLLGLYKSESPPSPQALEVGHLPYWTENPFVLASLTDKYNHDLRQMALDLNVKLIDLQAWGDEVLTPPEKYMFDSVHFNLSGLKKVGKYLAEELIHDVAVNPKNCRIVR